MDISYYFVLKNEGAFNRMQIQNHAFVHKGVFP